MLEATLIRLTWVFVLAWWLWIGFLLTGGEFDWRYLHLVVPSIVTAWAAGKLRQRRFNRMRSPEPGPDRAGPAAPHSGSQRDSETGPEGGPAHPAQQPGAERDPPSLNRMRNWTCSGCRMMRGLPGPQPCGRCGKVTPTVWGTTMPWAEKTYIQRRLW